MSTIDLRPYAPEIQRLVDGLMDVFDKWAENTSVPEGARGVAALNCLGAISGQLLGENGCPKNLVDFLLHSIASHSVRTETTSTEETISNVKH